MIMSVTFWALDVEQNKTFFFCKLWEDLGVNGWVDLNVLFTRTPLLMLTANPGDHFDVTAWLPGVAISKPNFDKNKF